MNVLMAILIFVYGLIAGSFVNAWVWRLRQHLDDDGFPKKLSLKKRKSLSILRGRSMCPSCKHTLASKDLVPIFSWLWLRGKCRYCKAPISIQYPLVEIITGLLFVMSYVFWPYLFTNFGWLPFIGWLCALVPLIAMAIYDAKWFILPSRLIYIATGIYTISITIYAIASKDFSVLWDAVIAGLLYLAVMGGIYSISELAQRNGWTKAEWLGFGDVRLAVLLGLIAGSPMNVFIALFLASILGLIVASPSIIQKKVNMTSQIPFGPFLIAGAILALFFGSSMISWYTTTLLGF